VITNAIPVLEVVDVARTIDWYREMLGFTASPFPKEPPFHFAILDHRGAEIMLMCGTPAARPQPRQYRWDVYLRLQGQKLRETYATLSQRGVVTSRLERMFYGLAEFEITDPDGYVLCLSEALQDDDDLPTPEE
jgi:uncharacterized glyoxalase superfamily protein PhnB